MSTRPFPKICCSLCSKPMDLRIEPCTDESGKAIHWVCYLKRLVSESPEQNAEVA
jgi:hypothetical protein